MNLNNRSGHALLRFVTGLSAGALLLLISANLLIGYMNIERRTRGIFTIQGKKSDIHLTLQRTIRGAIKGPLFVSRSILTILGLQDLYPGGNPIGAILSQQRRTLRENGAIVPTGGIDDEGEAYDIVAVLHREGSDTLTLVTDTLISPAEAQNGNTFSLNVSGDSAGYAVGDVIAVVSPVGTQLVQLSQKQPGRILLRVVTDGTDSLRFRYLPGGSMVYRVGATLIGKQNGADRLAFFSLRPGDVTLRTAFSIALARNQTCTDCRFKVERLRSASNIDSDSSWESPPSSPSAQVPTTNDYSLRLIYGDDPVTLSSPQKIFGHRIYKVLVGL